MRHLIFCLLFLLSINTQSQVKNFEFTYKYKVLDFSTSLDKNNQYKSFFSKKIKKFNQLSDYLFIKVISQKNDYVVVFDDILGTDDFTETEITALKSLILPYSPIYNEQNTLYAQNNLIEGVVIKFSENDLLEWKITSESKKILNYDCFKAIPVNVPELFKNNLSLVPLEIWFCPELNIKVSPSMFSNLPGAVLEMNYKNFEIIVDKINHTDYKIEFLDLENYNLVDYQDYLNLIKREN